MNSVEEDAVVIGGVEVIDIQSDPAFATRDLRKRDPCSQIAGMERMAHAILENPDTVLQLLANCALDLCSADGAGVSIQRDAPNDDYCFHLAAAAGRSAPYLNAVFPGRPSPSSTCLDRGRPQLFRIADSYFKLAGVEPRPVTDGLLIPWRVDGTRATFWVVANGRREAFDRDDLAIMQILASVASLSLALKNYHRTGPRPWAETAASGVTAILARRVSKPLQKLTDLIFSAANGKSGGDAKLLAERLTEPLETLTSVVEDSLGHAVSQHVN